MAKNGGVDKKKLKRLRKGWIENHPDLRAANGAVEQAQKLVKEPKWVSDPAAYCASSDDAAQRVREAKQSARQVADRLKGQFNQALGLAGDAAK
jgi:hypothetical protein